MTLFDMFNKAAGLTEDAKKYNTGDISEKTGLQKQPDGSWKPPKAKGSQPKGTDKKVKATFGPASRLFETKLPPKVSFHSKDRQTEILNNIAKRKSQSGKVSESDLSIPHEEVKEHLNASKYYKQKAKGFTKSDPSYKKYLAKAEEYENKAKAAADDYGLDFSEFIDDSAPLTADTRIKLSQIKTTDDAKRYNTGDISEKTGLQKQPDGSWKPPKQSGNKNEKNTSSNKQEIKEWEESAKSDAKRYNESMVVMQHPDGRTTVIRESSPDIDKAESHGYKKMSLVRPDGSVKKHQGNSTPEKKASEMNYKEAEKHLNEKQKELLNNMAKQNGSTVEEVFEVFKDVIGFGKEQDPKLAEELDRNTRFEQEKLAKKRQKKEEELRQQRQEGEAAARAFKEKIEKGEIVYNEKTGQFEDAPQKSKTLTRTEATERVFQNHIKEFKDIKKQYSKLPRNELVKLYSQKVSRVNSVETLPKSEIAEALTQHEMASKYSSEIRELRQRSSTSDTSK